MDSDIAEFMSVTGASREDALMYLEMAGEAGTGFAVSMYFDHQGNADLPAAASAPSRPSAPRDPIPVDDEEYVRAPIAPQRARLMDPDPYGSGFGIVAQGRMRTAPSTSRHVSAFGAASPSVGDQPAGLADLYRPPTDLMYTSGPLSAAFSEALKRGRWLMVNLMNPAEFACETQNLDLWRDGAIKSVILSRFVFVQYGHTLPDGVEYQSTYGNASFPHIAVLDPRTRERVLLIEYAVDRDELMATLDEFLATHSQESATYTAPAGETKRPRISEMSEEEQLMRAIEASEAEFRSTQARQEASESNVNGHGSSVIGQESGNVEHEKDVNGHEKGNVEQVVKQESHPSMTAKAVVLSEPPVGAPNSTRIQIRFQDGSRIVLRVEKSTLVRQLFGHLRATRPELADTPFELVAVAFKASTAMDSDVESAGLAGASLNCDSV